MISSLRSIVARTMPHGADPESAGEVQRALRSRHAAADRGRIDRIVRHATNDVPYYQRLGPVPFESLPVVSKPMIVGSPQNFLAVGSDRTRLASRLSSGTSGIMFRSYFDSARIARHRAELVGAYRFLGADPFGSFLHCREWFEVTRRERIAHGLRGQRLYSAETDERAVRDVARWLGRRRGTVVMGLCSYIETLLSRFAELGIDIAPGTVSVVLGAGEPATTSLRTMVREQFGVELSMRYSNTENGLLGFTRPGGSEYALDTSTYHVEILDLDSDLPAPAGSLGRVVVTDLFNRAMPFLRYDTGDLGRFALDGSGRFIPNALAELAGRIRDFPLAGTEDAPRRATHFKILEPVEQVDGITQFQLRQHDFGRFTWLLNAERSDPLEGTLRRILDEEIGGITDCRFVYSDDALHSGAGKRQTFVNEMPDPEAVLRGEFASPRGSLDGVGSSRIGRE